jgi:hypothetical protein
MLLRLILAFVLIAAAPCYADGPFPASQLRFKIWFASRANDPAGYCLLGNGFILAYHSANVDSLIADWLAGHPNAKVIPVDGVDPEQKRPRTVYIWIVDGDSTLNEFLIREGAVRGSVMVDPLDFFAAIHVQPDYNLHRLVSDKDYHAFLDRIEAAERAAKAEHKGIWAEEDNWQRDHGYE